MKRHHLWAMGGIFLGSGVMAAWAVEHGEKHERGPQQVTMAQMPPKARAVLLKLAGENKILGILIEKDEGVATYQGVWRVGGKPHSATLTVEGALVATEETVEGDEVPPAVRKAAEKLFPGAQSVVFEKATKLSYEIFGAAHGKKRRVEVSPAGVREEGEGREGGEESHERSK
jgi:hypothetical protein